MMEPDFRPVKTVSEVREKPSRRFTLRGDKQNGRFRPNVNGS